MARDVARAYDGVLLAELAELVHALLAGCSMCRRLEGVPLALELAAARIRTLSVWQIADRLTGRLALLTTAPVRSTFRPQKGCRVWTVVLCSARSTAWWTSPCSCMRRTATPGGRAEPRRPLR
ncbi:hypothetical protein [Saccharopolyspora taberi]|uniref:Uncharacterized protein n=1 Tax=Saccharopolyspora taberi TaxID=60895 RepID=A0ABN3VIS2_9PSEU